MVDSGTQSEEDGPVHAGTCVRRPMRAIPARGVGSLWAAAVVVVGLAGGGGGGDPAGDATPTTTASSAAEWLAEAGLVLPESATDVVVEDVELVQVEQASLVRFRAPRADVEAMCRDAGREPLVDRTPLDYEREMLGEHAPQPGDAGCVTAFTAPLAAFVSIAQGDPTGVAVLVYQAP